MSASSSLATSDQVSARTGLITASPAIVNPSEGRVPSDPGLAPGPVVLDPADGWKFLYPKHMRRLWLVPLVLALAVAGGFVLQRARTQASYGRLIEAGDQAL